MQNLMTALVGALRRESLLIMIGGAVCFSSCNGAGDKQGSISTKLDSQGGYELVWSDEFDYEGLPSEEKWVFESGDGCPHICGWGNNEEQYYTDKRLENARVKEGMLIIEAHKEPYKTREYSSAKLLSKGTGDWQYGKFLIKAKLPEGRGTWPAIWMLPTLERGLKWPMDGEIDIMEHVGYDQGKVHGTIHTEAFNHMKGTHKSGQIQVETVAEEFHEYGLEWTPEKLTWLFDGEKYFEVQNPKASKEEWPFNEAPFHLILNIAVGGNWGGKEGIDDSIWPQRLEVDYVRVYQQSQAVAVSD